MAWIIALFFSLSLLVPATAHAKFKICNETSYVLDATLAERFVNKKTKGWQTRGWFRLYPGFCEVVIKSRLRQKTFYIHARSAFEHRGRVKLFGGTQFFCVAPRPGNFVIKGRILCREKGNEKVGFARVQVTKRTWVHRFKENHPFHTPNHAMVAGIQRLLRTNGFEIGGIDGYWGKLTQRTIQQFQRSIQKKPSGFINHTLFEQLLTNASALLGVRSGFKLCNETPHWIWASVGYRAQGESNDFETRRFESKGWIRVLPKSCAMLLRDKLSQPRYYIYAEAVDKNGTIVYKSSGQPLTWHGDFPMCLKRLQFKIKKREQCQARGYQSARFLRVETKGREGWTEYFYERREKAL